MAGRLVGGLDDRLVDRLGKVSGRCWSLMLERQCVASSAHLPLPFVPCHISSRHLSIFAEHLSRDILGKRRCGVLLGIYHMVFLITIYMIVQFILSGRCLDLGCSRPVKI